MNPQSPHHKFVDSVTKSSTKKSRATITSKKEKEDCVDLAGGLQTGNDNVMGKKRKRGEADDHDSDISEENPTDYQIDRV